MHPCTSLGDGSVAVARLLVASLFRLCALMVQLRHR
jgi:hypothetical protein